MIALVPRRQGVHVYSFHHVAYSVVDLDRSVSFYESLGFLKKVIWEADDGSLKIAHLALGDLILELFCYKKNDSEPSLSCALGNDLEAPGVKHLGLKTRSLPEARRGLETRGHVVTDITQGRTGIRYFFVRDPDGIWLEIVEE